MAGSDARALHNPFIAGINHFFKVVVGQNLAGKITAYTQNTNLFYSFSHVFILVSLFFFVFDDNFSNITALVMDFALLLPWQMINGALTPKSSAPPYSVTSARFFKAFIVGRSKSPPSFAIKPPLEMASFITTIIALASPSANFKTTLPTKPSQSRRIQQHQRCLC